MKMAASIQAEVSNGAPLPEVSVIVLTAMKPEPSPGDPSFDPEAFNKTKLEAP